MMKNYFFLALTGLFLLACGSEEDDLPPPTPCTFDVAQIDIFTNYSTDIILKDYATFISSLESLQDDFNAFKAEPTAANLIEAQDATIESWLELQGVSNFHFGPAADARLVDFTNKFPLDVAQVEANLQDSVINLENADLSDKGFPALDYLFFRPEALDGFTSDNAAAYFDYAETIILQMLGKSRSVLAVWDSGFNDTFLENTGTGPGSSISFLVNSLNENFDRIKINKLGLPAGAINGNAANTSLLEAPYSKKSLELANRALVKNYAFYQGIDGLGIDDLVRASRVMKSENVTLFDAIDTQYQLSIKAIENIQGPLQSAIVNDRNSVVDAVNTIQKNEENIEGRLPSLLCVE